MGLRRGKKLAWYKWYPHDFQTDEKARVMTPTERGIYRDLLDSQWIEGSLPGEREKLVRLVQNCTKQEFDKAWPAVKECFEEMGEGRIGNRRLRELRDQVDKVREKLSESGKFGAENRWNADSEKESKKSDGVPHFKSMAYPLNLASGSGSGSIGTLSYNKEKKELNDESGAEAIVTKLCVELRVTGKAWGYEQVSAALARSGKSAGEFLGWIGENTGRVKGQAIQSVCAMFAPLDGVKYKTKGDADLEYLESLKMKPKEARDGQR